MSSYGCFPRVRCYEVEICCKCCGADKCYRVEIPIDTIIAQASLTTPLAYTNTAATTIIFQSVTMNEGGASANPCGMCFRNPCCCKKKKKKCKSGCSSRGNCGGCGPCGPYPMCPPCNPYGGVYSCPYPFYNPTTGIATVPYCGAGQYQITVSATTNSADTTTMSLRVNGNVVVSTTLGTAAGSLVGIISTQQPLQPGQTVYVTVQDSAGAATISAATLTIVRLY